jgi:hypothetical protein
MRPTRITAKWMTIATVSFDAGAKYPVRQIEGKNAKAIRENRAAHGCVCHLQARVDGPMMYGRKVNCNGTHTEASSPFLLSDAELQAWQSLAHCTR